MSRLFRDSWRLPADGWSRPGKRRGWEEGGFSLIEALVAMAIIASAIIISSALLNTLVISADHLRVQGRLLNEIESAVEMMRAGLYPLESGPLSISENAAETPDLSVTAIVEEQKVQGLYRVSIRAECSFRRRRISQSLITEIWRP